MDDLYFLVSHKSTGNKFRAKCQSKNALRKSLPRFCTISGEYSSLWDISEISGIAYFNKRELPVAPYTKEYPPMMHEDDGA